MLTHIVAMSENGVIGLRGGLPWHIPEDFKFFKRITTGHAIVMGRKTYESIGKPLPGRLNVVITRDSSFHVDGVVTCKSMAEALSYCKARTAEWGEEIFVIGGGEIYAQTIAFVDRIYLTRVHVEIEGGDTFYPQIALDDFEILRLSEGQDPLGYSMLRMDRK